MPEVMKPDARRVGLADQVFPKIVAEFVRGQHGAIGAAANERLARLSNAERQQRLSLLDLDAARLVQEGGAYDRRYGSKFIRVNVSQVTREGWVPLYIIPVAPYCT
jgi:hypothetical protein